MRPSGTSPRSISLKLNSSSTRYTGGRRHRLNDGPAGLLGVLAEEGALDCQVGRVHHHTLIGVRTLLPSLSKEREDKGSREPPLGGHGVRRDFGILPEVAPAVPQ